MSAGEHTRRIHRGPVAAEVALALAWFREGHGGLSTGMPTAVQAARVAAVAVELANVRRRYGLSDEQLAALGDDAYRSYAAAKARLFG